MNFSQAFNTMMRHGMVAACCCLPLVSTAAESELLHFSLEGHDGEVYTEHSWPGRALVLFLSSREGALHNENRVWSTPIVSWFSDPQRVDRVMLLRIADLRVVPRLFRRASRGMVLEAITPTPDDPLRLGLMDWDGAFAEQYALADDAYNLLVFSRQGQLLYRAGLRDFDQQSLDRLLDELEAVAGQL